MNWRFVSSQNSCGNLTSKVMVASFIRGLIPFIRAPLSWLHHLPKSSPPNIITLGIKFSTYEFGWGYKHSDHSATQTKTDHYFIFQKNILIPNVEKMLSQNDKSCQERTFYKVCTCFLECGLGDWKNISELVVSKVMRVRWKITWSSIQRIQRGRVIKGPSQQGLGSDRLNLCKPQSFPL